MDAAGNLFIADVNGRRVRRVDAVSGIITTVAGTGGDSCYSGDGGPATSAGLCGPWDVAIDSSGNLFITEDLDGRIRRVDAVTGIITTVAGNGSIGYSGDGGPATSATLDGPTGVAVDGEGNVFFADWHENRVRRIDGTTGIITTVAGNGIAGSGSNGGPATSASLNQPNAVALDGNGNLFISDGMNSSIRRVDAVTGVITRVAGGNYGFSGDGGPATGASLAYPYGLALDGAGNLFISDSINRRIRRVPLGGGMTTLTASPNPATAGQSVTLTATVTGLFPTGTVTFTNNGSALATIPVVNGEVSYTQVFNWANTKSIEAAYSGDAINQPSTSVALNLVVNPATSTTTLVSSENPANVGDSVTFAATVTSSSGLTPPDGGLVTFTKNGTVIATVPITSGQAMCMQAFEVAGAKQITASYAGDVTNQASTSAVLVETVN